MLLCAGADLRNSQIHLRWHQKLINVHRSAFLVHPAGKVQQSLYLHHGKWRGIVLSFWMQNHLNLPHHQDPLGRTSGQDHLGTVCIQHTGEVWSIEGKDRTGTSTQTICPGLRTMSELHQLRSNLNGQHPKCREKRFLSCTSSPTSHLKSSFWALKDAQKQQGDAAEGRNSWKLHTPSCVGRSAFHSHKVTLGDHPLFLRAALFSQIKVHLI